MAKQKQPEYRLGYVWDDYLAEYRFVLQRDNGSSFREPEEVEDGDFEWAERQAKHYGIELPSGYFKEHDVSRIKPQESKAEPTITINNTTNNPPIAMSTPSFPPTTPGVTN